MRSLVEAALQTLPSHVTLGAFFYVLIFSAIGSIFITKVSVAISMRPFRAFLRARPQEQESLAWAERARAAFPLRTFTGLSAVLIPAFSISFSIVILRDSLSILPNWSLSVIAGLISLIWPLRMRLHTERVVRSIELPFRRWLRGGCALWILMAPHFFIALIISIVMPNQFGPLAYGLVALCIGLGIFIMRISPLPLLKALGLAKAASARLSAIVDKCSKKAGLVPRAVYEIELPWANAYAFPLAKRLAFTDELLTHLSDEEIDAVCAHELGHLGESAGVVATRVLSGLTLLIPLTLVKPLTATGRADYVAYVFLGAFLFLMVVRRIFRRMEVQADKNAHAHEEDAGTYARALVRIYEVNVMPVVLSKGSGIHPDLYDRVAAAGSPFPFPRPKAPARIHAFWAFLASLALFTVYCVLGLVLVDTGKSSFRESGSSAEMVLLGISGSASSCGRMGELCEQQNRKDCAVALYALAAERDYNVPRYASQTARLLAESNRCEMASEALTEASERLGFWEANEPSSDYERILFHQAEQAVLGCYQRRGIPPNAM